MKHRLSALSLALLFFLGCQTARNPVGPGGPERYFPNSPGSWWVYRVTGTGGQWVERVEIEGITELSDGTRVAKWVTKANGSVRSMYYVLVDSEGVRTYWDVDNPLGFIVLLKFPLEEGVSWNGYRVEGKETVTTPRATFKDCYKIAGSGWGAGGPWYHTVWFKPYVGQVMIYRKRSYVMMEETATLDSFHIQ